MARKFRWKTWMTVGLIGLGVLLVFWPMVSGFFGGKNENSPAPWEGWLPIFRGPRW